VTTASVEIQFIDIESKKCFSSSSWGYDSAMALATTTGVVVLFWDTGSGTANMILRHWVGFDLSGDPDLVDLGTVISSSFIEQVDAVCTGTKVCISYTNNTDMNLAIATISPFAVDSDSVVESSVTVTKTAIGLQDATQGFVAYIQERSIAGPAYRTDVRFRFFSVATGPTGSATNLVTYSPASLYSPSRLTVVYSSVTLNWKILFDWDSSSPITPNSTEVWEHNTATIQFRDDNVNLASRAFYYQGFLCAYLAAYRPSDDTTNVSLALRAYPDAVSQPSWGIWSDYLFQGRTRPGSSNWAMPVVSVSNFDIEACLPYSGNQQTQAVIVNRSQSYKPLFGYWNSVLLNNITPNMMAFDGRRNFPAGFPTWPIITLVTAAGSGAFTGTYGFSAIWERVDNEGNAWRSAPSLVYTVAASSNNTFNITVKSAPFFDSSDEYQLVIYRTTANGTIFYRVAESIASSSVVTVIDQTSDTDAADNPLIYTDGGAFENVMPPAVESWALARDRLFLISAEDQNVYPTKLRVPGEGVGFSDALRISLAGSGDLQAIGAMDDKVIVFGEESHTVLYGVGPDDFGAGQFEQQLMSGEVGCIDPRSVILGDKGLFFQSRKGLWLLGRDLSSVPVGIPMDLYKTSTFVGAMSPSDRMLHWWFLSSGTVLVFDEFHNRWSRFLTTGVQSSALVDTKPVFLTSTGAVWREDTSIYTDNGVAYECQATLGWLSFANLQGFQKVRRISVMGESQTAAFNCVAKTYYDFVDTLAETVTAANATVKPSGTAYQWEWKPKRQKCEALKLDLTWTASGSGASIVSIGFEVGGIPGLARRIKAAKRVKGV
jgi:hypothetical protein